MILEGGRSTEETLPYGIELWQVYHFVNKQFFFLNVSRRHMTWNLWLEFQFTNNFNIFIFLITQINKINK